MSQVTILHVAEDELSAYAARSLLDAFLVHGESGAPDWLREQFADESARDTQRTFVDFDGKPGWARGKNLGDLQTKLGVRVHARGENGYALVARKLLAVGGKLKGTPDFADGELVVLASFDGDGRTPEQCLRHGAKHVAEERRRNGPPLDGREVPALLIAEAAPEFDAWVLAGFEPSNDAEKDRLAAVRARVGFDPTTEPHRLHSTSDHHDRDAKHLAAELLALDGQAQPHHERVQQCLANLLVDTKDGLAGKPAALGLGEYLQDLRCKLLPLLTGAAPGHDCDGEGDR